MILDGYIDLPPGKLASVVTYVQMFSKPAAYDAKPVAGVTIRKVTQPAPDWYRMLFRRVGENWLWFSRLLMSDAELAAALQHPQVDVFAMSRDGEDLGLLELDRRVDGEVEIAMLGVAEPLIGTGAGRLLMKTALDEAWSHNPRRVWLHTCSLDHPKALAFYEKAGFVPYKRAIEVADDPRLIGALPRTAAPHVPLIL